MNINKKRLGFSLIELLVVISIIAIITSIAVANFITAQRQARDSARKEIITNAQTALEQYYAEYSAYPSLDHTLAFSSGTLPTDPKNTPPYQINWTINAQDYCICATMENSTGNSAVQNCTSWADSQAYYCAINKQ